MSNNAAIVVLTADWHCGSTVGLSAPVVELEESTYVATEAQQWIYRNWVDLWRGVAWLKRRTGVRVISALVGDIVDRNVHSAYQLVSVKRHDIIQVAKLAAKPMLGVADRTVVFRGTEAHSGGNGELEEWFSSEIGAGGTHWRRQLDVEGVKIDCAHHPETSGFMPWTQGAATARCGAIVRDRCVERGEDIPDIVARAHVHYCAEGPRNPKPHVLVVPAWQLTTAYGYRRGGRIEAIGAWVIWCSGGNYRIWGNKPVLYRPAAAEVLEV